MVRGIVCGTIVGLALTIGLFALSLQGTVPPSPLGVEMRLTGGAAEAILGTKAGESGTVVLAISLALTVNAFIGGCLGALIVRLWRRAFRR